MARSGHRRLESVAVAHTMMKVAATSFFAGAIFSSLLLETRSTSHRFLTGMIQQPSRVIGALFGLLWLLVVDYLFTTVGVVSAAAGAWFLHRRFSAQATQAWQRMLGDFASWNAMRTAKKISPATHFAHHDNKSINSTFQSVGQLLAWTSWKYMVDGTNMVTLIIIIIQGIGSNWKKHWMYFYLYVGFYLLTLLQELLTYRSQNAQNEAENQRMYRAICWNDRDELLNPATNEVDHDKMQTVPAERLGLGNLVYVEPGQAFPIDCFAIDATTQPFEYALNGEDTVSAAKPPVIYRKDLLVDPAVLPGAPATAPFLTTTFDPITAEPRYTLKGDPLTEATVSRSLISRGSVHSGKHAVYVVAACPLHVQRSAVEAVQPAEPNTLESRWQRVMGQVFRLQGIVLLVVATLGTSSGLAMRPAGTGRTVDVLGVEVTVWSFVSYFLGQFVMGNNLIPVRIKTLSAGWIQLVKHVYSNVVEVKRVTVIEDSAFVANYVSDKTGTLTSDQLQYDQPITAVLGSDGLPVISRAELSGPSDSVTGAHALVQRYGPSLLLLNNDSIPNPLFKSSECHSDSMTPECRLLRKSALGTSSEEAAIYCAVAQTTNDMTTADTPYEVQNIPFFRDGRNANVHFFIPYSSVGSAVQAGQLVVDVGGDTLFFMALHFVGDFDREFTGRLSVASIYEVTDPDAMKQLMEQHAGPVETRLNPALKPLPVCHEGLGLRLECTLLSIQGGNDVVAQLCGAYVARWEEALQTDFPERTLGHAVTVLTMNQCELLRVSGPESVVNAQAVRALHRQQDKVPTPMAGVAATPGVTPTAAELELRSNPTKYQLMYLSKFRNSPSAEVSDMVNALTTSGVRIHVCSGDTYLTLEQVMRQVHLIDPNTDVWGVWDEGVAERMTRNPGALPFRPEQLTEAAPDRRIVVFCGREMLDWLYNASWRTPVQQLLQDPRVVFCWYRSQPRQKPKTVELMSQQYVSAPSKDAPEVARDIMDGISPLPVSAQIRRGTSVPLDCTSPTTNLTADKELRRRHGSGSQEPASPPIEERKSSLQARSLSTRAVTSLSIGLPRRLTSATGPVSPLPSLSRSASQRLRMPIMGDEGLEGGAGQVASAKADDDRSKAEPTQQPGKQDRADSDVDGDTFNVGDDLIYTMLPWPLSAVATSSAMQRLLSIAPSSFIRELPTQAGFLGDGPNDAPALLTTPYSFAMHSGCQPAKDAASIILKDAGKLRDVLQMSRLYRGGSHIMLRDLVFIGSLVVVLLTVSAHMTAYEPIGSKIYLINEPYNPLLMSIFAALHTMIALMLCLVEGGRDRWQNHDNMLQDVMLESGAGMAVALWVGMGLKSALEADGYSGSTGDGNMLFGSMALASLMLVMFAKHNLLVRRSIYQYQWLPTVMPGSSGDFNTVVGKAAMLVNSYNAQVLITLIYWVLVSGGNVWRLLTIARYVIPACAGPISIMLLLRVWRWWVCVQERRLSQAAEVAAAMATPQPLR